MSFSRNLCELMKNNGVSSYKLAKSVGVHVSTVTNWLNGANPKLEHIVSVSNFFGVNTDDLLKEGES